MEDLAMTDAPGETGMELALTDDTSTELVENGTEQATEENESEEEGGLKPDGVTTGAEFRAIENGRLNPQVKAELERLKTEKPELAKSLEKALFTAERFRREFPNGFKGVSELRQKFEQLGGEEGIQEMTGELDGWRDFDRKYTSGDPELIKFMTDTPEAAAGFQKIMPLAFDRYRELNKEGYESYVSAVYVADMQAHRIPLLIERLQDFLPEDKPQAKEIWKSLAAYINRIGELASKPVKSPDAAAPAKDDQRAKDLESRETKLRQTEWKSAGNEKHTALFRQAWSQLIGQRKLTPAQSATVRELYGIKLQAILNGNAGFHKTLEKYFGANQKEAFLRHYETTYKEAVPKALRAAIAQAGIGQKPGPQAGGTGKQASGTKKDTTPSKPDTGFVLVNAKPGFETVNRAITTAAMWNSGRAVLKDGKRVQWKK